MTPKQKLRSLEKKRERIQERNPEVDIESNFKTILRHSELLRHSTRAILFTIRNRTLSNLPKKKYNLIYKPNERN